MASMTCSTSIAESVVDKPRRVLPKPGGSTAGIDFKDKVRNDCLGDLWRRRLRVRMEIADGKRCVVVFACVLGAVSAIAEELGPEQAKAFVAGKLFAYTCFDGTVGTARILSDGSVVGTIRPEARGDARFITLPPGTIKVNSTGSVRAFQRLADRTLLHGAEDKSPKLSRLGSGLEFCLLRLLQLNPRVEIIG